jgi:ABC-type spermidine/putrescine transport system permease subunit I
MDKIKGCLGSLISTIIALAIGYFVSYYIYSSDSTFMHVVVIFGWPFYLIGKIIMLFL